jgi:O-antigen/teichoic acid export membrane protein
MDLTKTKAKAVNSAKWLVIISLASSVCAYFSTVLLGRISPEALGQYSLIQVFINFSTTCICFGGAVILGRYIPQEDDLVKRSRIFWGYVYMVVTMYVLYACALLFIPNFYLLLVGEEARSFQIMNVLLVLPMLITSVVISYFLLAVFEAKAANLIGKSFTIVLPIIIFAVGIINRPYLASNIKRVIFLALLIVEISAFLFGFRYINKKKLIKASFKPLYPEGSFQFLCYTFFMSFFSFVYQNVDKVFLASLGSMGQLGYFQAIIQIVTLIELIPSVLRNVTIPYFSVVIKSGVQEEIKRSYHYIERYCVLFVATACFGVMALSKPFLMIFGSDFAEYRNMLTFFLAAKVISSRGFVNTPMLVNLDKNNIRFLNSVIQITLQLSIIFLLIEYNGLLAVILARIIALLVAQILPQYILRKSTLSIKISKEYIVIVIFSVIYAVVLYLIDISALIDIAIGMLIYCIAFYLAGFRVNKVWKDAKSMLLSRSV